MNYATADYPEQTCPKCRMPMEYEHQVEIVSTGYNAAGEPWQDIDFDVEVAEHITDGRECREIQVLRLALDKAVDIMVCQKVDFVQGRLPDSLCIYSAADIAETKTAVRAELEKQARAELEGK